MITLKTSVAKSTPKIKVVTGDKALITEVALLPIFVTKLSGNENI